MLEPKKETVFVLTSRNSRAHVHSGDLDALRRRRFRSLAASQASAWARSGLRVVVDDDAHAGTALARAELDLGALDECRLGKGQGAVETGQLALVQVGGGLLIAGEHGLAHALESSNLRSLVKGEKERQERLA